MVSKEIPPKPWYILPVIVFAQFAGTSLWFVGNAVLPDLQANLQLGDALLSHLTSAVQLGFIVGTLAFAILTLADRFSPSLVFLFCAIAGTLANALIIPLGNGLFSLLLLRFITGFFLAGIYPVGMKIASDWHQRGLGLALGFLVGALVVGTAFPHLIKHFTLGFDWSYVLLCSSAIALSGGLLIFFCVPNGPFRKTGQQFDLRAFLKVFRVKSFRSAAFGYFGHMWELYTFWAFVPVMLTHYGSEKVSLYSFWVIALGGISCAVGGYYALRHGSAKVAFTALLLSGLCCLVSPFAFAWHPSFFIAFLIFWGLVVIADSPQFSTLVAQTAPPKVVGTALTIVNCIGFSITIISLQVISYLTNWVSLEYVFLFLAAGPLAGLITFFPLTKKGRPQ